MSDKNFRELQVSSSQLVVIFLAILILGLVIFLLGVSVGKKQTEIVLRAAGGIPAVKEKVEVIQPNFPILVGTAAEAGAKPPLIETKTTQPPSGVAPQTQTDRPETKAGAKPESKLKPPAEQAKIQALQEKPRETPGQLQDKAKIAQPPLESKEPVAKAKPLDKVQAAKAKKQTIYYVQVGAFNTKEQAQSMADRFIKDGYPTLVVDPGPDDRKLFYRVRLGGYLTRQEAEDIKAKLKTPSRKSGDYLIIKIEN